MIFTRDFLTKAFAVLLILGFVVELFIVYTYSPSAQQQPEVPTAPPVETEYISASLVPFTIRSFTDSMLFVCNSTEQLPSDLHEGFLGRPVQIGAAPAGKLFLARSANGSISNSTFLRGFSRRLASSCNSSVVFREALVVFNGSIVELVAGLNPVAASPASLSKQQLDGYQDRFGRGAIALVSDIEATPGSVVELRMRVVLSGSSISPGSLLLEQPIALATKTARFSLNATVISFTGRQLAVVDVPWENRTVKPSGFFSGIIEESFTAVDEVVLRNSTVNQSVLNYSFINRVEQRGSDVVLVVGNFTDRAAVIGVLSSVANVSNFSVEFPVSKYVVEFNGTAASVPFAVAELLKESVVSPANASISEVELPVSFSALVNGETKLNETVPLLVQALVDNGVVATIQARQQV